MNQDNKEAGSDMKFLFWDDPGDSQENVDNQKTACSNHARELDWAEEEEKLNERMDIIGRNGATAEGYLKTCISSKQEKAFIDFSNNSRRPDGKHSYCKDCSNQKNKEWREKNPEKNKDTIKKWRKDNADKIREYKRTRKPTEKEKEGRKLWEEKNAEKLKQYQKEYKSKNKDRLSKMEYLRKKNSPTYRAICNIRSRTSTLCSNIGAIKNSSITKSIGLSIDDFKLYIESKFVDGMSWDNYGEWHIDHIIPLHTAKTIDDVMKLNNYKNLQPLWWFDNLKKGSSTPEHYPEYQDYLDDTDEE